MTLSPELKEFILSFCKNWKIRNVDLENIGLNTSLDGDLNIFNIEMNYFLDDFVLAFNIDTNSFKWGETFEYPDEDDMSFFYTTFRCFDYKINWVKRICHKFYTPKVFVKDFQYAIDNGFFEKSTQT